MQPTFFANPGEFSQWLRTHNDESELLVGYWKKASKRPSMTWEESVDEALCWGWIDGIRRSIDDEAYSIRFTPRRKNSIWSPRNLARVAELTEQGRMQPPGLAVYHARKSDSSAAYLAEQPEATLTPEQIALFGDLWAHFQAQPAGYRKQMASWVQSAKQDATRARRLAALVEASRQGIRVNPGQPFAHLS